MEAVRISQFLRKKNICFFCILALCLLASIVALKSYVFGFVFLPLAELASYLYLKLGAISFFIYLLLIPIPGIYLNLKKHIRRMDFFIIYFYEQLIFFTFAYGLFFAWAMTQQ